MLSSRLILGPNICPEETELLVSVYDSNVIGEVVSGTLRVGETVGSEDK